MKPVPGIVALDNVLYINMDTLVDILDGSATDDYTAALMASLARQFEELRRRAQRQLAESGDGVISL